MSSMLAAVHGAMSAQDDEELPDEGATGARASQLEGKTSMSTSTHAPAGEAGISQAALDKAVADATAKGLEDGRKAESARIAGIDANMVTGREALIAPLLAAHKADAAMTPAASALAVIAALNANPQADVGAVQKGLEALNNATNGVTAAPSGGGDAPKVVASTPEAWAAEYAASTALQAEYPSAEAYVAFAKRQAVRKAA